jgi:hypothetical protein
MDYTNNKLQLYAVKCKEMVVDFKKVKHQFGAILLSTPKNLRW